MPFPTSPTRPPLSVRSWVPAVLLSLTSFLFPACAPPADPGSAADVIFTGRFVTLDPARPEVEALGVAGGRVVAAGTAADVETLAGAATRRVDVPGIAVPGLADAHAHVAGLGAQLETVDLRGLSKEQVLEQVAALARSTPAGGWIQGRGWDEGFWRPAVFPTAADLDRVAPDHPVVLRRIDGHSLWASSRALALAGISRETPDPPGGRIVRTATGDPTGVLVDRAMDAMSQVVPAPTRADVERRVRAALAQYARWGLTSVHDAGAGLETIAIYKELLAAGELPVRLYVMARGREAMSHYLAREPETDLGGGRLTVRSFKVALDGALGSRGAQLAEPYADAPEETGLVLFGDEELARLARDAGARGFQVNAHAIGDRAIRRALDVFEAAGVTREQRFRIEHVSVVSPDDLPRLARLGVVASMQPNFVGEYSRWAADRVGPSRVRWVYPLRELHESGALIAAGSDYPAADSGDPIATLYCLVTRKGADGEPAGGWFPEQRVGVVPALEMMTAGPAFAAFQEDDLGRLSPGRHADFTVLSADPRATPAEELRTLTVRTTVVGGEVIFNASSETNPFQP